MSSERNQSSIMTSPYLITDLFQVSSAWSASSRCSSVLLALPIFHTPPCQGISKKHPH